MCNLTNRKVQIGQILKLEMSNFAFWKLQNRANSKSDFAKLANFPRGLGQRPNKADFGGQFCVSKNWAPKVHACIASVTPYLSNIPFKAPPSRKPKMKQHELKRKSRHSTHVRFSDSDYKKISKVAESKKMTIPELLRLCYDTVEGNPIEIPKEELTALTGQLLRIGNNVNTALRKINSGEYDMLEDIKDTFEQSATEIRIIKSKVSKIL